MLVVLRDHLDLTGTKYGCGEGQCAACTVLINGQPRHACQTRVATIGEQPITTIEGLERNGKLHPVQQAFLDTEALQCGYCTPGMILGAVALLARNPSPAEAEVRAALNGHICRCNVYPRVLQAVALAAQRSKAAPA